MIVKPCLPWRTVQSSSWSPQLRLLVRSPFTARRGFHPSAAAARNDDGFPNHYATLELSSTASPAEIKKQFYALSKSHHPDLHPNDPHASERFVEISEAYAVLGSVEKRARYDRDYSRVHNTTSSAPSGGPAHPSGSFSSASTPAGGRPASGLSRRRTHFRGPPPSFYRSGGWGAFGEKRAKAAQEAESAAANATASSSAEPGTGPGGFARGLENDVPHFDHQSHYQTHSEIERTRHRARRRSGSGAGEPMGSGGDRGGGGSTAASFLTVSGILLITLALGTVVSSLAIMRDPRRPNTQKGREQS